MRLSSLLEGVLAACVGLGLARYRLTGPELAEILPSGSRIPWVEEGIDDILAGVALVGGLGTFVERARGKSPGRWGPGRWVWATLALYLCFHLLDWITDVAASYRQLAYSQASLSEDIIAALRGKYFGLLLPAVPWFLAALGVAALAAPKTPGTEVDAREWTGRAFATVLVIVAFVFKVLLLLGIKTSGGMGGG